MNRFERDLLEALDGNEKEVLERRKKELSLQKRIPQTVPCTGI